MDAATSGPGAFNPYGVDGRYRSVVLSFRMAVAHESWNEPSAGYDVGVNPIEPEYEGCMDHHAGWVRFGSLQGYFAGTGCCDWAPGTTSNSFVDMTTTATVDGPNHYTIEVLGSNTKLWINGTLVFDYTEDEAEMGPPPSTYGGITIKWTWEQEGWVDNVVVTDLR